MTLRHLTQFGKLSHRQLLVATAYSLHASMTNRELAQRTGLASSAARRARSYLVARGILRRHAKGYRLDTLAVVPTGQPDGQTMPSHIAMDVARLVPEKMRILARQVGTLKGRGWEYEALEAEVLTACVSRWQYPRSRYNPERGDLDGWVFVVARSRLGQLLARKAEIDRVGSEEDVALSRCWG